MHLRRATPEEVKEAEARVALALAAHEAGIRAVNESRRRLALVVVPLFVIPFVVIMFTFIGPLLGMAKMAAPFACPSDYESAYVKKWRTSDGTGKDSDHWEVRCMTPRGDVKGDDGPVYFVSGSFGFALSMMGLAAVLVLSRKKPG